jgi:hypothetical protein
VSENPEYDASKSTSRLVCLVRATHVGVSVSSISKAFENKEAQQRQYAMKPLWDLKSSGISFSQDLEEVGT